MPQKRLLPRVMAVIIILVAAVIGWIYGFIRS